MERIIPFREESIIHIVDKVYSLWSPSAGDIEFKRLYVEYIVRNNLFENTFNYELTDEDGNYLSSAFFTRKGDKNMSDIWLKPYLEKLSDECKSSLSMCKTYLDYMEKQTFSLMNEKDIKLSLFVSGRKGAGFCLLKKLLDSFRDKGCKNVFLWTDCECNWQWYLNNAFTLVKEDIYPIFSHNGADYKTYIFKKALN